MKSSITPAMQDYLEGVLILLKSRKIARVRDLARLLKVKASSVIDALTNLTEKGLVVHERYGRIELTRRGLNMARKLYKRHCTLTSFFTQVIGVGEETAEGDACKIEHYLSRQTMDRIIDFMSYAEKSPEAFQKWLGGYNTFIGNNHANPGSDNSRGKSNKR